MMREQQTAMGGVTGAHNPVESPPIPTLSSPKMHLSVGIGRCAAASTAAGGNRGLAATTTTETRQAIATEWK